MESKGQQDNWKQQTEQSKRKRKHKEAFGAGKINWAEKRAKKRQQKMEKMAGDVEPYEINNFEIGSDKFNEYYTVSQLTLKLICRVCRNCLRGSWISRNLRSSVRHFRRSCQ